MPPNADNRDKNANEESNQRRTDFVIQTRLNKYWYTIRSLGNLQGGFNGGIFLVSSQAGQQAIYKKAKSRDIKTGLFSREIGVLQQIQHCRYVTRMLDHYVDERKAQGGLVLEYCAGGDLDGEIRRRREQGRHFREMTLWTWFGQLMDALAYCHAGPNPRDKESRRAWNMIFHRDIKPGNILLSRTPAGNGTAEAKLADFGCAKRKWDIMAIEASRQEIAKLLQKSMFTPMYNAPESPKAYYGRSDVWQLAAVVVCMCHLDQDWRVANPRMPAGPKYSRELNALLEKCMRKHWEDRPQSWDAAEELRQTFEGIKHMLPNERPQFDAPFMGQSAPPGFQGFGAGQPVPMGGFLGGQPFFQDGFGFGPPRPQWW